jgi:hypothetical protein
MQHSLSWPAIERPKVEMRRSGLSIDQYGAVTVTSLALLWFIPPFGVDLGLKSGKGRGYSGQNTRINKEPSK